MGWRVYQLPGLLFQSFFSPCICSHKKLHEKLADVKIINVNCSTLIYQTSPLVTEDNQIGEVQFAHSTSGLFPIILLPFMTMEMASRRIHSIQLCPQNFCQQQDSNWAGEAFPVVLLCSLLLPLRYKYSRERVCVVKVNAWKLTAGNFGFIWTWLLTGFRCLS